MLEDKIETVSPALVGLELQILSKLLASWCTEGPLERRKDEWPEKLPTFRAAVSRGIEQGNKESWPRELIWAEYWMAQNAIEALIQQIPGGKLNEPWGEVRYLTIHLETERAGKLTFERPFPAPTTYVKCKRKKIKLEGKKGHEVHISRKVKSFNCGRWPHNIAKEIVYCRLNVSEGRLNQLIRDADDVKPRYSRNLSPIQMHLASVFLDLCSEPEVKRNVSLAEQVLHALADSGFHFLGLYYLVQLAHNLSFPLVEFPHHKHEIQKLCSALQSHKD